LENVRKDVLDEWMLLSC